MPLDINLLSIIVFLVILVAIIYKDRKKFERQGILVFRKTQRGKDFLFRLGTNHPRFWKWFGNIAIPAGFIVAIWFIYLLIVQIWLFYTGMIEPIGGIILPSPTTSTVTGPGFIGLPFWYFIIIIAVLMVVHESCHGILASREGVKVKSLGWFGVLFFPLLMGAFVEPDEKQMSKKKTSSQLRILAVGSFSNFILALVSIGILLSISLSLFTSTGVGFQAFPGQVVGIDKITAVNGFQVSGFQELRGVLEGFEQDLNVNFTVGNVTLIATPQFVLQQLNQSNESVGLLEDLPAYNADLSGIIVRIDDFEIREHINLEMALENRGPGKRITIVARTDDQLRSFNITTIAEPEPVFTPDSNTEFLASMEQSIPGYIDFSSSISKGFSALVGSPERRDWRVIQRDIKFWEYLGSEYPALKERSEAKTASLKMELANQPRAGFIGISQVSTQREILGGLEFYSPAVNWITGLFFWMFIINFAVGGLNMLPLWITDGGRMWALLFEKITKKHYKKAVNILGIFSLALIVVTFLFLLRII